MSNPDGSVIGPPDDPAHDPLPNTAQAEPAMTVGAWVALASLGVGILADLGLPLTDAQQRWVYLLVIFFGPVVSGLLTRSKVFSPLTVDQIVQSLQWRLRGADLDASDAIAAQKAVQALYPAVHTLLTAPQAQGYPQAQPLQRPNEGLFSPGPATGAYPRLESTETMGAVGQSGRHSLG